MCGIAGIVGSFAAEEGASSVAAMNETLRHRGPDDEGLWAHDGFAFAMRRLSIIDLAGGHQPMWSGDKEGDGLGIVFNGEIYNYRALRDALVATMTTCVRLIPRWTRSGNSRPTRWSSPLVWMLLNATH